MTVLLSYSKALADETRLRLAAVLLEYELSVGEIVSALGLKQSRISRHLKILADSGLVEARRDGQWVFYCAAIQGPGREYLNAVRPFLVAEQELLSDVAAAGRIVDSRAAQSARFFDNIAGEWERMRAETLGGLDIAAEVLARMPDVDIAADLGCGTGRLLSALAPRAGKLIGVDNAQGMLDEAGAHLAKFLTNGTRISLRIGELEHLPLRDGEASFATMCLALHHLSSPEKGVREAYRILAPGGRFILADFDKHDDETLRTRLGDRWLGFTPAEVDHWLTRAGFTINETVSFPLHQGLTLRLAWAEKPSIGGSTS